jgi:hypothetical protein
MPVTREGRGAGGCFKLGCLGCLVIVGLPVLFVMGLLLLNVFTGHEEVRPESRELARELPPLEQGQIPEEMTEPGPEVVERLRRLTSSQAVTVMLDVSELQFRLEPGPAGEPIRVEADFDTGSYELSESMEEDDELGSVYHLRFAPKRPWWLRLLRRHDVQNEVRLILPRDVPLALAGNIGFGESRRAYAADQRPAPGASRVVSLGEQLR